ncbi:YrrS family protein [Bacillus sp. NPDC077027]|uniref:YrrS family protein n=1 Tax=Bacillus sp. NPDC077027 TaxID=3390548 RepID=UPI003D0917D3
MSKYSRFEHRDKRRKANIVLNILIAVVVVLILVVASSLLIFQKPKNADVAKDPSSSQNAPASSDNNQTSDEDVKDQNKDTSDDSKAKDDKSDSKDEDSSKQEDDSESDTVVNKDALKDAKETDGGATNDVAKTYENEDWKPVGTEQSGTHTATYDSKSKDWEEMIKAMSYATGIPEDQMTVIWLGNNGGPQDAKGTIRDKSSGERYRVNISWVDEKGWKPVKVEKLK